MSTFFIASSGRAKVYYCVLSLVAVMLGAFFAGHPARAQTASWGPVASLSAAGQDADDPQIALSGGGTTAASAWYRSDGSKVIVQSRCAAITGNNAAWGVAVDLSAAGQHAVGPQIAISSDGSAATAVWSRYDGANWIIQSASAAVNGNTAGWSTSSNLSTGGQNAYEPRIVLSSDGSVAAAVWYRSNGSHWIVQARFATINGNTAVWGPVVDLSAAGEMADGARIALSSNGTRATAVWSRFNGSNSVIQSRSATISGNSASWGDVANLSAVGQDARYPAIALSSDGVFASAVWERSDGSNDIIQASSAAISGNTAAWGLVSNLSSAGQDAGDHDVSLSSDGSKAAAVWRRSNGSNTIVQFSIAAVSGNSAAWTAGADLSAAGQDAEGARAALSSDGTSLMVVWQRSNGSNTIIQSRLGTISENATVWGDVSDISSAGQNAVFPVIALSSDGTLATAGWKRSDGSHDIIQSSSAVLAYPTPAPAWSCTLTVDKACQRPNRVVKGKRCKFTARVREQGTKDPVSGAQVFLMAKTKKADWARIKSGVTRPNGTRDFKVRARKTASYRSLINQDACLSKTVKVTVR